MLKKTLYINQKGAMFDGFKTRLSVFFNHSVHIEVAARAYYGSVKPKRWFINDDPSLKDICKINHLDIAKHTYVFYGHKIRGGIAFHLYEPDKVEAPAKPAKHK